MKKLFAILMIAMMLVCFMPSAAFAYDAGMTPGQICAEKTVVGPNQNGNYEIKLSVVGKNVTETTGSNADVVLVVDNSGSMREGTKGSSCDTPKEKFDIIGSWESSKMWRKYIYTEYECPKCHSEYWKIVREKDKKVIRDVPDSCTSIIDGTSRITVAKSVAKEFAAGILKDNSGNLLAIIGFSHGQNDGGSDDSGAIKISHGLTDSLSDINSSIDSMQADGGTNYSAALNKAYGYLNARTDKTRPGYVIFISDGAPGYSGESLEDEDWNGSKEIAKLKEAGITVFTVGIDLDTEPANYLKNMASDANHFINVTGDNYAKQLSDILKLWAKQINSKPAGTEAVMEDIVDTEKFEVVGFSSGIKQDSDGRYVWEIGDITEEAQTQTIEIKPLVSGTDINTNTDVNLTYKDPNGETQIMPKDKIGDPTVDVAKVTFNVENGKWADESTGSKTVLVPLSVSGSKGTLKSNDVPTGMKANAGYEGGEWDVTPDTSTDGITGAVTYTYTFMEREPVITDTVVTFKVINGTWSDSTTDAKTVTVKLADGKGTLNINDVPTGMKANDGYEGGEWDVTPDTSTDGITGNVTYTFCFSKKDTPNPPTITVYYTIRWNNYDDTNLETDRFCYYGQMPSYDGLTPVKPADEKYTYVFIGWDKEVVKVTKDETYTAQFKAIEKEDPTNPTDPTQPEKPIKPENPAEPKNFDDETELTIPDTEVPKTGDTALPDMLIYTFLLALSALGGILVWHERKEKTENVN